MQWYSRWISSWERELAAQDRDRQPQPFDWGLEWMDPALDRQDPGAALLEAADSAVRNSDEFFAYETPSDFRETGGHLTFTSPLTTPFPENNTVHGEFFPAAAPRRRAVIVLPQWNAGPDAHIGLCRLMNRFGLSALRMSKAYHHQRMPAGVKRAEHHVSSNLGRTIHATRQSVVDARCCVDWLASAGYDRIGIAGTSLGSCVSFIAAAHEPRIRAGAFNHVSGHFGDVVWTGLATGHVRESLQGSISRERLRRCWSVISPAAYFAKLGARDFRSLVIWTKYDPVFLPEFSRSFVESFPATQVRCLPCGHYTIGEFPFNWLDGLTICRFLSKQL